MGTASTQQNKDMMGGQQQQTTEGVGSPITNEAYNVLTALQAKLEGLEAYRKYSKDQGGQLWQKIAQSELESVRVLVDELERLVKDGKLKMREPGRANA
jgi:hypothetical protein